MNLETAQRTLKHAVDSLQLITQQPELSAGDAALINAYAALAITAAITKLEHAVVGKLDAS